MNEERVFIVRAGEVALKGMNKPYFERVLAQRIKKSLNSIGKFDVKRSEGLIFVRTFEPVDNEQIIKQISKVFGVASVSPAFEVESDMQEIGKAAVEFMMKLIKERGIKTFKVKAKRADKEFPIESPEIGRIIGAKVLIGCKVLKVDVHNPQCLLFVDVRKGKSYIYEQKISGFGGLPLGTNGKGLVLLSGGIDSPVAAFLMAKRGMLLEAVHFHSYPYTSQRARQKVEELAGIVAGYSGRFKMHVVNLLPIQEAIVKNCKEEETTILVRRFMMRIAEQIALQTKCMMLITGENLGQVASQTAEALVVTDAATNLPVMRPLIALDKIDIIDKAREIGTYETSIEPYEDCCTVFLPKHPLTKPKLERIIKSEEALDVVALVNHAIESKEEVIIYSR
ncbi:MAG: tRNA uracil 4-sulfurtransferase ThiI [Eubacteriales bacterium]